MYAIRSYYAIEDEQAAEQVEIQLKYSGYRYDYLNRNMYKYFCAFFQVGINPSTVKQ